MTYTIGFYDNYWYNLLLLLANDELFLANLI